MPKARKRSVAKRPPQVDDSSDNIYIIEKILDVKKEGMKNFYLVKWEGFSETTWEPKQSFEDCPEVLAEFQQILKKRQMERKSKTPEKTKRYIKSVPHPVEVMGATENEQREKEIYYLIRFSDDEHTLLASSEVCKLCPQLLIDFLQSKIVFKE